MDKVRLLDIKKILDDRGNLSVIESNCDIPFTIKRTYWIYDVPGGEVRGGHAFKEQKELIIALSGSFDVLLNDGKEETVHSLNRAYFGLHVPNNVWRQMKNFSTNSVALVLSSTDFSQDDYIYDLNEFLNLKND